MIEFNLEKQLFSADGLMELQVDVQIEANSFVTIYGKSGAGKTSILRMLAGLMHPDTGYIWVNGNVWLDTRKILIDIHKSEVLVFCFRIMHYFLI